MMLSCGTRSRSNSSQRGAASRAAWRLILNLTVLIFAPPAHFGGPPPPPPPQRARRGPRPPPLLPPPLPGSCGLLLRPRRAPRPLLLGVLLPPAPPAPHPPAPLPA